MLTYYPSVSEDEYKRACNSGSVTLANLSLEISLKDYYGIHNTVCDEDKNRYCLFLYLYALQSNCVDPNEYSILTEQELIPILAKVEELQKQCCLESSAPDTTVYAPLAPLASNGIYTDGDATNPANVSVLVDSQNLLNFYTVASGGVSSIVTPALPTSIGVTTYYVSQTVAGLESPRVSFTVTILPRKVITVGLNVCSGLGNQPVVFTNLYQDAVVRVYDVAGTYLGATLSIDTTTAGTQSFKVSQVVNSLESALTLFSAVIKPKPVLTIISGNLAPKIGENNVYTTPASPDATQYSWFVDGVAATGATNEITLVFSTAGAKVVSVQATGLNGCVSTLITLNVTAALGLINTIYTNLEPGVLGGTTEPDNPRKYKAKQNVNLNPNDNVTYAVEVLDNPINAIIPSLNGVITSPSTTGFQNFRIDATNSFLGGTVKLRSTLISSSLGAPIGIPKVVDIQATFASVPHCPPGYTLNGAGTSCTKVETTPPIITQTNYCLTGSTDNVYASLGTRIYNLGFSLFTLNNYNPPSSEVYAFLNTNGRWKATSEFDGPFNPAGVWIDSDCNGVKDSLLAGQQVTVAYQFNNLGASRIVYVGLAADNKYTLIVNGSAITLTDNNGSAVNFKLWHIIPVAITSGINNFNIVAEGDGSVNDALAMVIYDNTALEIVNSTADSNLNVLFTTANVRGQRIDIATCSDGYSLDTSGGQSNYVCKRVLTSPVIP